MKVKLLSMIQGSNNSKNEQHVFPSITTTSTSEKVQGSEEKSSPRRVTGWISMGRLLGGGAEDPKEMANRSSAEPSKAGTDNYSQKSSAAAALLQPDIKNESLDDISNGKEEHHGQSLEARVMRTHQEMLQEMRQRKRSEQNTGLANGPQSYNDQEECHAFLPEPPEGHNNGEIDQLDLGFIHKRFKRCLPPMYALRCTLLVMASMALTDSISTYGLIGLLIKQTFTMEALILGMVEYSALSMIVLHYIIMKRRNSWESVWLEVLTAMTPIAQTLGLLYWTFVSFKENGSSTRVHNFVTLNSLLRGVVVSPLMIVAMSYFYLTEVVTPPWQETTTFCDSMHNCVPLGPLSTFLPPFRFGLSLATIFTGFLEGYQATNLFRKAEIVAFSLPSSTYRAATLILTATYAKEYALILLLLIVAVNISVDRLGKWGRQRNNGLFSRWCQRTNLPSERGGHEAERTIINLVTALSSIVDISVVPAEPAHQERNPEPPEDPKQLKELRNISTIMSLATFPIFLVANIGVYFLSQSDTFLANPNNVLTRDQINFLTLYVLFPLAAVYVATIIFFHLTFLSSREWCKYFKAAVIVLSILATFASLLTLMSSVFPTGPSKIVQ